MKKYILIIALVFSGLTSAFANDSAYIKAMKKQLESLEKAKTPAELQNVANAFMRISEMNSDGWLPDYYAALALINAGFLSKEGIREKDAFYNEAKKHIDKAIAAQGENSELLALKGYALMGELTADPSGRGQSMSGLVMNTFGQALSLNPENPRAMVLMAQMELGMSRFFGTGPEKSCSLAQKSKELFEKEEAQSVENPLAPKWGQEISGQITAHCK